MNSYNNDLRYLASNISKQQQNNNFISFNFFFTELHFTNFQMKRNYTINNVILYQLQFLNIFRTKKLYNSVFFHTISILNNYDGNITYGIDLNEVTYFFIIFF